MLKISLRYSPLIDAKYKLLSKREWSSYLKKSQLRGAYPSEKQIRQKLISYEEKWRKEEKKIILEMQRISGLHFSEKEIVVYIVGFGGAQSDPLIIPSHYTSKEFIAVLTHELLHRLLTYNREGFNEDIESPKIFKKETTMAATHVFIHALLERIYIDTLQQPSLLRWDMKTSEDLPDYKRAWKVVKEQGSRRIIKLLREARTTPPSKRS